MRFEAWVVRYHSCIPYTRIPYTLAYSVYAPPPPARLGIRTLGCVNHAPTSVRVNAPTAACLRPCANAASGVYTHLPVYTHPTPRIRRGPDERHLTTSRPVSDHLTTSRPVCDHLTTSRPVCDHLITSRPVCDTIMYFAKARAGGADERHQTPRRVAPAQKSAVLSARTYAISHLRISLSAVLSGERSSRAEAASDNER